MNKPTLALLSLALVLGVASAQTATPEKPLTPAQCRAALEAKANLNTEHRLARDARVPACKRLPGVVHSMAKDIVLNRSYANQRGFEVEIEIIGQRL